MAKSIRGGKRSGGGSTAKTVKTNQLQEHRELI